MSNVIQLPFVGKLFDNSDEVVIESCIRAAAAEMGEMVFARSMFEQSSDATQLAA